jgi:hypothetical protein
MIVINAQPDEGNKPGGEPVSLSLGVDNDKPKVKKHGGKVVSHDSVNFSADDPAVKYDATDKSETIEIELGCTVEGGEDVSISSATAIGKVYTISPPSGNTKVTTKADYMRKAGLGSAVRVDLGMGGATLSHNGELYICSVPSTNVEFDVEVEIADNVVSYNLSSIVRQAFHAASGDDDPRDGDDDDAPPKAITFCVIDKITVGITGTTTGGLPASGEGAIVHADGPIAVAVDGVDSGSHKLTVFDTPMHMVSGWIDGSTISISPRTVIDKVETTGIIHTVMATAILSTISPRFFSKATSYDAMVAEKKGDTYDRTFMYANNAIIKMVTEPSVDGVFGKDVEGSATLTVEGGVLDINTSNVKTATSRCVIAINTGTDLFSNTVFDVHCGVPKGDLVVAAVDCKIANVTATNIDSRQKEYYAGIGDLHTFHSMIDGFQNMLTFMDLGYMILSMALMIMTRGISCILMNNMMSFVFYLVYEIDKLILGDAHRNAMMGSIGSVIDRYSVASGHAKTNMSGSSRKQMAHKFMITLDDSWFKAQRALDYPVVFIFYMFCVPIAIPFPRYYPWVPTTSEYGVPLSGNFLDHLESHDPILTDEHYAMLAKNVGMSAIKKRIDYILTPNLGKSIRRQNTFAMMQGFHVILKQDNKHQEYYATGDKGYALGELDLDKKVEKTGQIADIYEKFRENVANANSVFAKRNMVDFDGIGGRSGERKLEAGKGYPLGHWRFIRHFVIDEDAEVVHYRGERIPVKIVKPNKYTILAMKRGS